MVPLPDTTHSAASALRRLRMLCYEMLCCDGITHQKHSAVLACCGSGVYDSTADQCCGGNVPPPQKCRIKVGAIDAAALGPFVK